MHKRTSIMFGSLWACGVLQFQMDMSFDGKLSKNEAKALALKSAKEYYYSSEIAKEQYLKWQLKIR